MGKREGFTGGVCVIVGVSVGGGGAVGVGDTVKVGLGWATVTLFPGAGRPVNTAGWPPLFPL